MTKSLGANPALQQIQEFLASGRGEVEEKLILQIVDIFQSGFDSPLAEEIVARLKIALIDFRKGNQATLLLKGCVKFMVGKQQLDIPNLIKIAALFDFRIKAGEAEAYEAMSELQYSQFLAAISTAFFEDQDAPDSEECSQLLCFLLENKFFKKSCPGYQLEMLKNIIKSCYSFYGGEVFGKSFEEYITIVAQRIAASQKENCSEFFFALSDILMGVVKQGSLEEKRKIQELIVEITTKARDVKDISIPLFRNLLLTKLHSVSVLDVMPKEEFVSMLFTTLPKIEGNMKSGEKMVRQETYKSQGLYFERQLEILKKFLQTSNQELTLRFLDQEIMVKLDGKIAQSQLNHDLLFEMKVAVAESFLANPKTSLRQEEFQLFFDENFSKKKFGSLISDESCREYRARLFKAAQNRGLRLDDAMLPPPSANPNLGDEVGIEPLQEAGGASPSKK